MNIFNCRSVAVLLIGIVFSSLAHAFDVPNFTPNVVDRTGVLSREQVSQLNVEIQNIRQQSHIFAAVLLVNSLNGETIEEVAEKTFRDWQLGQKGVDNGLLIIASLGDRRVRIEVGYGLEGSITDSIAMRIIDIAVLPNFKQRMYFEGISKALQIANDVVLKGDVIKLKPSSGVDPIFLKWGLLWILFVGVIPAIARALLVKKAKLYPDLQKPSDEESKLLYILFGPSFLMFSIVILEGYIFIVLARNPDLHLFSYLAVGVVYICIYVSNLNYFSMISEDYRQDYITSRSRGGSDHSSGWSSSGSSSSSSGGGSSGGGGASSSW